MHHCPLTQAYFCETVGPLLDTPSCSRICIQSALQRSYIPVQSVRSTCHDTQFRCPSAGILLQLDLSSSSAASLASQTSTFKLFRHSAQSLMEDINAPVRFLSMSAICIGSMIEADNRLRAHEVLVRQQKRIARDAEVWRRYETEYENLGVPGVASESSGSQENASE